MCVCVVVVVVGPNPPRPAAHGCACALVPHRPQALRKVLPRDAILVGHSLENDLEVLKMRHQRVIDTAVVFNNEGSTHSKKSLKALT